MERTQNLRRGKLEANRQTGGRLDMPYLGQWEPPEPLQTEREDAGSLQDTRRNVRRASSPNKLPSGYCCLPLWLSVSENKKSNAVTGWILTGILEYSVNWHLGLSRTCKSHTNSLLLIGPFQLHSCLAGRNAGRQFFLWCKLKQALINYYYYDYF